MKFFNLSSICMVAFGNRSLYRVFIITISLSTVIGERIGELKERDRGRIDGDRRPGPFDPKTNEKKTRGY